MKIIRYLICDKKIKYKNIKQLKIWWIKKIRVKKKKMILKPRARNNLYFTTGRKGVDYLQKITIVAKMINKIVKLKSEFRINFHHWNSRLGRLKCFATNGHTIILNENPNNFGNFFDLLQRHKINGFFMVPSGIEILKNEFPKFFKLKKKIGFIELGSENKHKNTKLAEKNLIEQSYIITMV